MAENGRLKPKFSILNLLLILTIIAVGLAWQIAKRDQDKIVSDLNEKLRFQRYLKSELGFFDVEDDEKFRIRELENQVPLVRRFRICFPPSYYNLCAGDYLGGDFKPENLNKRHQYRLFFKIKTNLSLHIFNGSSGEAMISADTLDFNSGRAGGGYLERYQVDVNKLNFSDDQHSQAAKWRIANNKPHGELKIYPEGTKFIPLFILKEGIKVKSDDGKFVPSKGLAIWIEEIAEPNQR